MNKNRLLRMALSLMLTLAMVFSPILSCYVNVAAFAKSTGRTATDYQSTESGSDASGSDTQDAAKDDAADVPASDSASEATDDQTQTDGSDADAADTSKTEAQSGTKQQSEVDAQKKTEYVYEDKKIKVTAVLSDPDAIPDDAELVVTPVTDKSKDYNYDAYMAALNEDAGTSYDKNNTLLYDIAFLIDGAEIQPASGTVSVNFEFLDSQLSDTLGADKKSDISVIHLPLADKVRDKYDTTADAKKIDADDVELEELTTEENSLDVNLNSEAIGFETDSFSIYAISYTVDFEYNGYTFSLPGEGSIKLSEVFTKLDIDKDVKDVEKVTFSNSTLLEVKRSLLSSDWSLTSKKPFSSKERLTVTFKNNDTIAIEVTDTQEYVVELKFQSENGTEKSFNSSKKILVLASFEQDGTTYYAYNENDYDLNNKTPIEYKFSSFKNNKADPNPKEVDYNGQDINVSLYYADDQNNLFDANNVQIKGTPINSGDTFEGFTFNIESKDAITTITGTIPEYTVNFEFKDIEGNLETPTGITGSYKLYTSVTGPNNDNVTKTWYSFEDVNLTESSTSYSYSSFHLNNANPADKAYSSEDKVTVVFGKDLEADQNNGSLQNGKGTIISDGDVVGDYVVSVKNAADGKSTTYTFQKVEPYKYSISADDNEDATFDDAYSGHWYLLSTLTKSNGKRYYYVEQISSDNAIKKASKKIAKFYNADKLSAISVNTPSSNNSISVGFYQDGDQVENTLVYTGANEANLYSDVANGFDDSTRTHEVFRNDSVVNKYTLSSTNKDGSGVIKLESIPDLKLNTQFVDADEESIEENLPSDYYLLIKMVRSGKTYYALEKVNGNDTGNPIKFYEYANNSIDPNGTPYYYAGKGETISTQVVTNPGSFDAALINHEHGVFYNENTIGGNQYRDLTKDLYSSSSAIEEGESYNTLTTTFKAQPNNGVGHKITVDFYSAVTRDVTDSNKLTKLTAPELSNDDNAYYLIIELQNNGKTVGYLKKDIGESEIQSANNTGSFEITIEADEEFTLVDDDKVIIEGGYLKFDPTVYNSKVTLYQNNTEKAPSTLVEAESNGSRNITGYDFGYNKNWNSTNHSDLATKDDDKFILTETKLGLFSAYKKQYQVKVEFDGEAPGSVEGDYTFRVTADHATSGAERYTGSVSDALTGVVIEDQTTGTRSWQEYKNSGNDNWSETTNSNLISGSEAFTLEVGKGTGNNFEKLSPGYPVVIDGVPYTVTYDLHDMEAVHNVESSDNVTVITDKIVLKKATYDPAVLSQKRIGAAAEFGIVAGSYGYKGSHTETNFAVYDVDLPEVSIEGSGDGDVPFYAEHAKVDKFSDTSADLYFYTTPGQSVSNKVESGRKQADGSTKVGDITIIEKDADTIHSYVKGLIDLGRSVSDGLKDATNGVIRPAAGTESIDLTTFPDNITLYIDCTDIGELKKGFKIRKLPNQTIVFNISKSGNITIDEYSVEIVNGSDVETIKSTDQAAKNADPKKNEKVDKNLLQKIVFNAYSATGITIVDSAGLFLAPNAVTVDEKNSAGWVIAGEQTRVTNEGEMHFYYHDRQFSGKFALEVKKNFTGKEWGDAEKFSFTLTGKGQIKNNELDGSAEVPMPAENGKKVEIGKPISGTSNTGKFGSIEYTEPGTYVYEISEEIPSNPIDGVNYDTGKYTATVTVDEKLKPTVVYTKDNETSDTAEFTNTYTQEASGSDTLTGQKELKDADGNTMQLSKDQFSFSVTPATNNPAGVDEKGLNKTANNAADGSIDFGSLNFSKAGTYVYTVKETSTSGNGITVDPTEYTVTFDVSENTPKNGSLNVVKTITKGSGDSYETVTAIGFTNTYTATGEGEIKVKKSLGGRDWTTDDEFTFTITGQSAPAGVSQVPMPANETINIRKSDTDHTKSFGTIKFTKAGTYTYTVKETKDTAGGVTYDENEHTVTITVKDNGDGKLVADTDSNLIQTVEITNTYEATGKATFSAKKTLTGKNLEKGAYTFKLEVKKPGETSFTQVGTAVGNEADGSVTFPDQAFTKNATNDETGTYTYRISEVLPATATEANNYTVDGVQYDHHQKEVTVEVTDNGAGKLIVTYDSKNAFETEEFKNDYAASGKVNLTAKKTLKGRDLKANEFSFELKDASGKVLQTKNNAADGTITFDAISYSLSDVAKSPITYKISEVVPATKLGGVTYASKAETIKVTLKDNGDGTITATPDKEGASVTFENKYDASGDITLGGTKAIEGRNFKAGDSATFKIEAVTTGAPLPEKPEVTITPTSGKSEDFSFGKISYELSDLGGANSKTFEYKVTESSASMDGATKDSTAKTVKVTVTDKGKGKLETKLADDSEKIEFTNTFTEAKGQLTLIKSGKDGKALAGAEFDLYKKATILPDSKINTDGSLTTDADGKIIVNNLEPGTYYFVETKAPECYVTPSGDAAKTGEAVIEAGHAEIQQLEIKFANAEEGKGKITLIKTGKGSEALEGAEFDFYKAESVDAAGTKVDSYTTDGAGQIEVGDLDPGFYYFVETKAPNGYITPSGDDAKTEVAEIKAGQNGVQTLEIKMSNAEEAKGQITLIKTGRDGKPLEGATFDFYRVKTDEETGDELIATGLTTNSKGEIVQEDLEPGTYYFVETAAPKGYILPEGDAAKTRTATVKAGQKTLEPLTITMTNEYDAEGSVTLEGTKTLTGAPMADGQFSFSLELDDAQGHELATVPNDAEGKVTFPVIKYTLKDLKDGKIKDGKLTKEFTYYIKENHPKAAHEDAQHNWELNGMTYDGHVVTATVTAVDEGDGTIKTSVKYSDNSDSFANKYAASGSVVLTANKTLNGTIPANGQFKFVLKDKDGDVISTASNDENGTVTFEKIDYTEAGEYEYTIEELIPAGAKKNDNGTYSLGDTDYDGHVINVKVTVKDHKILDGELEAVPEYSGGSVTFANKSYTSVKIQKADVVDGTELDGCTMKVVEKETGNVIDEWTSVAEEVHSVKVEFDKVYTLIEITAPLGYDVTTNKDFSVAADGKITYTEGTVRADGVILCEDAMIIENEYDHESVTINKQDESGNPLDGATFTLYADEKLTEEVKSYTGKQFKIGTDEAELKDYLPEAGKTAALYLKETEAPDDYALDEEVYNIEIGAESSKPELDKSEKFFKVTTSYSITINGETEADITNRFAYTKLYLTKSIEEYVDGENVNSTLVFKVTGKNGDEDFEEYLSVHFNADGDSIQTEEIMVPAGIELTVEEVYSGNYKPCDPVTIKPDDVKYETITNEDGQTYEQPYYEVEFKNELVRANSTKGIINKYTQDESGNFTIEDRVGRDD